MFSALTGLRYSDIAKLTWSEVFSDASEHSLRFTQKKTEGVETLPISELACGLLGERMAGSEKVFPNLSYSSWQNLKLQQWCLRAGISRTIKFHAFRHTFATLQLSLGTDLYTISKMLGHRDISTTQIYAKVVDKSKREAADKIKLTL
ncbi:site-specific integrase [Spirosoma endophyticum]|uniref:Phage integrase family protein n=1 Tax=Spirosoma endophyticum TaxID=662367 RepID=A0A1I2ABV9_9BACT|nr:site-specific integrase [Spirosoma endophyticum]SFE41376.1 Phage integrase family protein [Spirosoma endophyticum]